MQQQGVVDSPTFSSEGMGASQGMSEYSSLSEKDKKASKYVWGLIQQGKRWKEYCGSSNWKRWDDMWEGKQWQRPRAAGLSQTVMNVIQETCETFIGHFIDDMPELTARARRPSQVSVANQVTKLLNWTDDLNNQMTDGEIPIRSTFVTGLGVRRVDWNPRLDRGRGATEYRFVDEGTFFPAPWTRDIQDARWIVEARNIPVESVKDNWEDGWRVPPGVWDGSLTPSRSYSGTGSAQNTGVEGFNSQWGAFTSTDGNATQIVPRTGNTREEMKDLCTLVECWIRQKDGSLQYLVVANGVLLHDGKSPYDDEEYPYAIYNLIRNKNSVIGYSMVGFIEKLQIELNEMHSYALDAQRYESDSPLVATVANAKESKQLSNLPGAVYLDRDPNRQGYYLLSKPGANPRWMEMQEYVITKLREMAGSVDILRGERPPGVNTLGGMEIIRDEANVLVNKMARHLMEARKREAILAINRFRQFFKDDRDIRIRGKDGKDEYFKMNERKSLGVDGDWRRANTIPENFEAEVDFTPAPPGGMQAKFERDLALLQNGAMGPRFLLKDIEFDQDSIEEITAELEEAQAAQAEAQAPQSGQGGGMPQADPETMMQEAMSIMSGSMG